MDISFSNRLMRIARRKNSNNPIKVAPPELKKPRYLPIPRCLALQANRRPTARRRVQNPRKPPHWKIPIVGGVEGRQMRIRAQLLRNEQELGSLNKPLAAGLDSI
ncbi:uncharacterized protein CIMG_05123 [Coccidioides immitis RS]|uniref:Uncharacterized protein n=1 Tax=Coccidioides immitis (strain RS) TaxID=246410 RepID=J3KEX7_COCIM|nr:uncharacterized protein CIMG_05123 [Coccidioides immitis RS]EAS34099.3 hypothetical protein CIMG_05123 [Coccidioides immitis RS]